MDVVAESVVEVESSLLCFEMMVLVDIKKIELGVLMRILYR